MAVARFAALKPAASVDGLLYTIERTALTSIVAVNIGGNTSISSWIVPAGQDLEPDTWIYYIDNVSLGNRNTFETFRIAVNVGDKLYVKSGTGDVTFFVNGIYDIEGKANVFTGAAEPESPQIGDVWINDSLDPKQITYWDGSVWAFLGITGPANVLTIGTVESAAFGDPAEATITGDSPNQTLNLVLPVGDQGPANVLSIGTVESAAFGDPAEATITGDSPEQTLNLVLPVGDQGPPNALTVGTVTTGEPGTEAEVEITGDSPNQTINFVIPEGLVGISNVLTVGTVTSVGPDQDPDVEITGDSPNQVVNFTLKQGIQGPPGDLGTASLKDLQDVSSTLSPQEGSLLVYDSVLELWVAKESPSNLADVNMVIMGAY